MNESKVITTPDNRLSARSKVISSWNTSWNSLEMEPILPVTDNRVSRSQKVNKSEKKSYKDFNSRFDPTKVITKENTIKSITKMNKQRVHSIILSNKKTIDKTIKTNLKDYSKSCSRERLKDNCEDNSKDRPKDKLRNNLRDKSKVLRIELSSAQIDDNLNDSVEVSLNDKSVTEKTDITDNPMKDPKNSILSKLRKRKNDSSIVSIDTESQSESVSVTKNNQSIEEISDQIKDSTQKSVEEKKTSEVLKCNDLNVVAMEVDKIGDICIRPDCYNKINAFYLFEHKFCSSECAVKQWTQDFQNQWSVKKKNL